MKYLSLSLLSCVLASGFAVQAAETPLAIDATASRIDIEVKATVDSFVGRLDAYDAKVMVEPETGEVKSARLAFRFLDVKTGKSDRDEAMHEWQQTDKHPDGVFTLASLTRGADGATTATGELTLHGVAREISFPIVITREGGRYTITGDARLDTRDFGLPIIKKFMFLKVDPSVRVKFALQGSVGEATAKR